MTSAGPSELMMMLLADARLPTGAHTQSAGLEPALRGGMAPSEVPSYISARLRTVTTVEAAAAVVSRVRIVDAMNASAARADQLCPNLTGGPRVNEFGPAGDGGTSQPPKGWGIDPREQGGAGRAEFAGAGRPELGRAVAAGADPSVAGGAAGFPGNVVEDAAGAAGNAAEAVGELVEALRAVDAAWRARTISPALRDTSVLLGRGYARLVRRLWPQTPGATALAAIGRPGRAVVLGVAAALAGLSAAQLVRLIGYDDAQTVAAAALKLEPMDPVVTIGWVMAAGPDIERMVGDLTQLTEIEQIPALGAPLIEQWAEIHSVANQRLFRA